MEDAPATDSATKSRNGEILGWQNVGRGHRYLVQVGTDGDYTYDLRSGAELGFKTAMDYGHPAHEKLGQVDKKYSWKDLSRYVGITAVATKAPRTKDADRIKPPIHPVTYARVEFKNPVAFPWLVRTTVRKVIGAKDADTQIRQCFLDHGQVPAEDRAPEYWISASKNVVMSKARTKGSETFSKSSPINLDSSSESIGNDLKSSSKNPKPFVAQVKDARKAPTKLLDNSIEANQAQLEVKIDALTERMNVEDCFHGPDRNTCKA